MIPVFPPNYVVPQPGTFGLTLSERVAIINWAVFDSLPVVIEDQMVLGSRYLTSVEFEPDDSPLLYDRMTRVLDGIPPGEPVLIPESERAQMHYALDACWFSTTLSTQIVNTGGAMSHCYTRVRYLFISHLLAGYPERGMEKSCALIEQAADIGINKRFALLEVPFTGKGAK